LAYLACGKPIVSCNNPSIRGYPYVYLFVRPQEFPSSVRRALAKEVDQENLMIFLNDHTREKRIETMMRQLKLTMLEQFIT